MNIRIVCFFLISSFFISSCNDKKNTVSPVSNYSYFPSNIGHEVIYDVDSISKNDFTQKTDTFHFQVKEVIESTFTDNEGRPALRLERYKRSDESQPWVIFKVWSANLTSTAAEKKEDNITFIKLVFPATPDKKWNGNAKNDMDDKEYKYTSVNSPERFDSFSFDSVLTVLQNDVDVTFYKKDYEIEKFAAGVGMFFKESYVGTYHSPAPPDSLTLENKLKEYTHYTEKIISFKN